MSQASCTSRIAIFSYTLFGSRSFASFDSRMSAYSLLSAMAFSKIEGLEVMPRNPSSSICLRTSRSSAGLGGCSPSTVIAHRPAALSVGWCLVSLPSSLLLLFGNPHKCILRRERPFTRAAGQLVPSRLGGFRILGFDGLHFAEPPHMPFFVAESRAQECPHAFFRQLHADYARAEHQHVNVVMLDSLMRRIRVVAHSRADPGQLVGGHARPHSAPANQHASLSLALEDSAPHRFRIVGIVRRILVKCAHVQHIISHCAQHVAHRRL